MATCPFCERPCEEVKNDRPGAVFTSPIPILVCDCVPPDSIVLRNGDEVLVFPAPKEPS